MIFFSSINEEMDVNMDKKCIDQNNVIPKETKKASAAKKSGKIIEENSMYEPFYFWRKKIQCMSLINVKYQLINAPMKKMKW